MQGERRRHALTNMFILAYRLVYMNTCVRKEDMSPAARFLRRIAYHVRSKLSCDVLHEVVEK